MTARQVAEIAREEQLRLPPEITVEPTTERDFEHLRNGRYRWLRLRCVETGLRSNQLISRDIALESVIHHARKLARAEPGPGEKR